MTWNLASLFVVLYFAAAALAAWTAFQAWRRWSAPGAASAVVLMLAVSWWSLAFGLQIGDAVRPEPLFWFKLSFIGIVLISPSFLVFTFHHTGRGHWVTRRNLALLALVPAVMLVLVASDAHHGWVMAGYLPDRGETFVGGPAFWGHALYAYALNVWAFALLTGDLLGKPRFHRRQTAVLIVGLFMPLVANIVSVFRLAPVGALDATPLGFLVTCFALLYNLRAEGLLDLLPIARDAVVESMADGVIMLDRHDRIVDMNPAARRLLGISAAEGEGRPLGEVLPGWCPVNGKPARAGETRQEMSLDSAGQARVEVRVAPLEDPSRSVRGRLVLLHDVSEVRRMEAELREQLAKNEELRARLQEQAIRDPLTGLYNRRMLEETLPQELARATRAGTPLSVALLDLDRFKSVNDNYGHAVGDRVLEHLAEHLRTGARRGDIACRFGGEEFVLVMPGANGADAAGRIDELRRRFREEGLVHQRDRIRVTLSAGIAELGSDGDDPDTLLAEADRALYAAKQAGRDRVHTAGGAASDGSAEDQ